MEFVTKKNDREIKLAMEMPEDINGCIEVFGADIVYSVFKAQAVVKAQSYVRGLLAAETESGEEVYSDQEIADKFSEWKLTGGNRQVKSKEDKLKDLTAGMDPDELQALLQSVLASQAE